MSKFINSNYKPSINYGATPQLTELRKDENGSFHHTTQLQRKKLAPKKNFELKTLLDAKVNLEKVNTKIFQETKIDFTEKTEQTNLEVSNAE